MSGNSEPEADPSVVSHKARPVIAIAFIVLLAGIVALAIAFPPSEYVPAAQWGASLESAGVTGILIFLSVGIVATSVGLPRQLVAFIGGLAYGTGLGLTLSLAAALAGCLLTVTMSRRYLADFVKGRFPRPIAALERLVRDDFFLKVLVLRLQPLGTNLMTNVCIGFTSASLVRFIAASAVGFVPQMLVFNLLGAGVRVDSQAQLVLSAALFIISVVLGIYLFKRHS